MCHSFACSYTEDGKGQKNLIEVWTKSGWPPEDMSGPNSFNITPRDAFILVAESKRLSLKHQWICYRDDTHYFVADAFAQPISGRAALKYGVRVNGSTGVVE